MSLCPPCREARDAWLDALADGSLARGLTPLRIHVVGGEGGALARGPRPGERALTVARRQLDLITATCRRDHQETPHAHP